MDQTARIGLSLIAPEQALKHVTHNQALVTLDALVQLAVKDRDLTAPPGSPAEGEAWIVGASASGAWAGEDHHVAAWQNGGWAFYTPNEGWLAWVEDEDALVGWDGTQWVVAGGTVNPTPLVGVNATADTTNRLSVRSNAVLFDAVDAAESGSGDCQIKVNKETAGDTATHLFQTGFSGRAEMGLAGDDDFHFKVSPDGSAWYEAMVVDKDSGAVSFPSGPLREVLTAGRTYYVDPTDGDDANDGLSAGAGGAFATVGKALGVAAGLDFSGFAVTVQLADDTYAENVTVPVTVGQADVGKLIIEGNTTTPSNVLFDLSSGTGFYLGMGARATIRGLKVENSGGRAIYAALAGAYARLSDIEFGACSSAQVVAEAGGHVEFVGDCTVSGDAPNFLYCLTSGRVEGFGHTITVSGTPDFSGAFADANQLGSIRTTLTFSGAATGQRYSATLNGIVQTFGGGASYFPGDSAGSTATGGQYA